MRENEFSRKMFMYAKRYHDIKTNKNSIFMSLDFSFVIIRIERGARIRWGARTEWGVEDIPLHLASFTIIVLVLCLDLKSSLHPLIEHNPAITSVGARIEWKARIEWEVKWSKLCFTAYLRTVSSMPHICRDQAQMQLIHFERTNEKWNNRKPLDWLNWLSHIYESTAPKMFRLS